MTASGTGSYGSTISGYTISGAMTGTRSSGVFTLSSISLSGTISYTVTVTDSRGRTASRSASIYVYPYSSPVLTQAEAARCNSAGTETEEGTYLAAMATATISSCNGKNGSTLHVYYRKNGDSAWTTGTSLSSGVKKVFGGGNILIDGAYQVRIVASDQFTSVERIIEVGAYSYTIHFKNGGKGVAFGKAAEKDNAVEIVSNWELFLGD